MDCVDSSVTVRWIVTGDSWLNAATSDGIETATARLQRWRGASCRPEMTTVDDVSLDRRYRTFACHVIARRRQWEWYHGHQRCMTSLWLSTQLCICATENKQKLEISRPPAVIWYPRSSICVMDSPAPRTSSCWHGTYDGTENDTRWKHNVSSTGCGGIKIKKKCIGSRFGHAYY